MKKLEIKIEKCIRRMEEACLQIPLENRFSYSQWLAQTYFYVQHATRVLAKASYRCDFENEELHKKLLQGINEEKNHEVLATNDLAFLDARISQFKEFCETSAYYQTLYHLIDTKGPFVLLGYFVTLEGLGAIGSQKIYDRIVGAHGEKASSFIKVHARLDASHYTEALHYLSKLSERHLEIVEYGIEISTDLYCNLVSRVAKETKLSYERSAS